MEEIQEPPIDNEAGKKPHAAKWIKPDSAMRMADLMVGAIAIAVVFWWLQYSTTAICCGDFDGYYHIKWARLLWDNLRAGHFPPALPWLPLTTLSPREYVWSAAARERRAGNARRAGCPRSDGPT